MASGTLLSFVGCWKVLPEQSGRGTQRIEHKIPETGKRVMILNARRLPPEGDRPEMNLLLISDRTETE